MKKISDHIRFVATEMIEASVLDTAIAAVRKIPGWKMLIKAVWPEVVNRLKGKTTKEAGPRELLISALVTLVIAMGVDAQAAANPDTLKKVIDKVTMADTASYNQQDVDSLAKLLPFNISKGEREMLKSPLSAFFLFQKILYSKINDGMKEIEEAIKSNPKWMGLGHDKLNKLIVAGLLAKINQPQYADVKAELETYLQSKKKNMSFISQVASSAVSKYLEKNFKVGI